MRAEETIKALMTALQSGDLELASSLLTENFRVGGLLPRKLNRGEFLAVQSELLAAMPDFSYNLSDVQAEGTHVRALINVTGTHLHDLALPMIGLKVISRTGNAIILPQTDVTYELAENRVASMEIAEKTGGGLAGLLQQIGTELPPILHQEPPA
jgi:hypothetical protein